MLSRLQIVRDQVLAGLQLKPGDVVLDVGTGDGLIGFGALEELGDSGRVIFSDVSQDLLDQCHQLADDLGVLPRSSFLRGGAEDLAGVPSASVDAVTTRAVLIYVADKRRAFAEFVRVLRPGGRISIYEPINVLDQSPPNEFLGFDVSSVQSLHDKIRAMSHDFDEQEKSMVDFDERDLLEIAQGAGFVELHLRLERDIRTEVEPQSWEAFLESAPNPLVPSIGAGIGQVLSADELPQFEAYLRPLVEAGKRTLRRTSAHLTARRPDAQR
jgi:SAM-dependent methyltransferase